MASTDSTPMPRKNVAYRVVFPIFDADGDLVTGATGLDSEISKDQGTFADCTNEATEIATSSGMYYLDLTSTEMNADCVAIIVKTSSSGAKTTPLVIYPVEPTDIDVNVTGWNTTAVATPDTAGYPKVTIKDGTGTGEIDTTSGGVAVTAASVLTALGLASGNLDTQLLALSQLRRATAQAGGASTITLDASASATDSLYNGLAVLIISGTGAGQARVITGYVGSTKVATVTPAWVTNPSSSSVFILAPASVNDVSWVGTAIAAPDTAGYPKTTIKDGTGTGELDTASGVVLAKDHTGANLATAAALATVQADTDDLQTRVPAALVSGRIDASVGAMATDTLTAAALKTDAVTEIVTALLTTQMTESYHADGSAPTLAQALHFLISALTEFSISGVTITAKKLDGSTTAATFTLDSATVPTSRTRAT